MNTPIIGSIRPIPAQDGGHAPDQDAARGALARLRGARPLEALRQLSPALPAPAARLPSQASAELLLNLAVRPAHATVFAHGTQAHDKLLHGTLALLASLAHADADPAVTQACRVLQEQAALRALAVGYRSALQAG